MDIKVVTWWVKKSLHGYKSSYMGIKVVTWVKKSYMVIKVVTYGIKVVFLV